MAEQQILRYTKDGIPVWVPMDKLEQWEQSQKETEDPAATQLKSHVLSRLEKLIEEAHNR